MAANTGIIKIALKMQDDGTIKVLQTIGRESEKTGRKGKSSFDEYSRAAKHSTSSIIGLKTAVVALVSAGGIMYLKSMASGFMDVAKSFERYELQLKTITGSSAKAKESMAWITEFASKTPYEFDQVTAAFVKLEAYGLKAPQWMKTLGDTSAAMGKDLNQTVEMFADAVVGEFERLKEFGVKTSTEGDNVTFKWSENGRDMTQTAIKTQSGISSALAQIFSRFDGSMDELAASWEGVTSNMSDSTTKLKKELGGVITKNQFFIEAVREATGVFGEWGDEIKNNRLYLMQLAKDGFLQFVGSVEVAIEAIEFFHMSWKGLEIGGHLALHGLGVALQKLYPMMRIMVAPLDAIFEGLEKLGMIDVNPFDSIATGLGNFKESSAEVLQAVIDDTNKSVERYDAVKNAISGWKNKIAEVPVAYIEANDDIVKDTESSLKDAGDVHEKLSKKAIAAQKKLENAVQKELNKIFDEIDAHGKKVSDANEKFSTDYKRISMNTYDFERDQLQARYNEYDKYVTDKISLAMWFMMEEKKINDEEAQAAKEAADKIAEANKSMGQQIWEATRDWSKGAVSEMNEMLWGAEESFGDIAVSWAKMITEMQLQKAASGLMDWAGSGFGGGSGGGVMNWFSGLFSAHGNAFNKFGHMKAYAHGGAFTNKIVDRPTMFAHGSAFGVMGEKGPEVVAPLFRASNGDMGVKAVVSGGGGNTFIFNNEFNFSGESGSGSGAQEMAQMVGASIQHQVKEVIRQEKRYGGMLYGAA